MVMMGEIAEPVAAEDGRSVHLRDFGAWMSAEQKRIFLLCQRMLQDRDEADSAAQDSFLKAYQAMARGGTDVEDAGKWITRIAINTCLDRLRSKKWQFWRRRPEPQDEAVILDMAAERRPNAEAQLLAIEIGARLSNALDRLSPRQRAVFTLRHFEDRSLENIAEILELDVGTVKAHLFRAVTKLREELRDLYASAA